MELAYPAPPPDQGLDFSVGGGLAPQPGQYTTQGGGSYGYEWMNAVSQAADLFKELFPVVQEYGKAFGLMPTQDPSAITVQPVPEPRPWYEDVPAWVWGLAAGLGAVVLVKLLD